MIAHREREAARFMLGHLDDQALKDIGIYRSQIGRRPRGDRATTRAAATIQAP